MNKRNRGFTLIEVVVVTGILGLLTVGIVAILLNTFRAKTSVNLSNKAEGNAVYILGEIRKSLINADSRQNVACAGNQVSFNDADGNHTVLACNDSGSVGYITMTTTNTVRLSENDVSVGGCNGFVVCEFSPTSGNVSKVNINFTLRVGALGTGSPEALFQKTYSSSVTLRN